jgi:glycosyltransferase involved in cell wall biosynthesis
MRVLHVQKVAGIGGSERHLLDLLPSLAARGVAVRMAVLAAGESGRFLAAARDRNVEVAVLPAGPDLNPLVVARLVGEIRRFRPDLVHTHLIHADLHGAVAAALAGVPTVASFHGTHPFFERPGLRHAEARALGRARRVIAISEWVARFLATRRLADPRRIRVVHYGLDPAAWAPPDDAERAAARARLGLRDEVVAAVASRLVPHKGHDTLLAALGDRPALDCTLLVAGDGPERARLEKRAADLKLAGAVRFLGFVDDVRGVLAAADLAVMPTSARLREGFGLAALEAQALGVPVVASRTASLPEVVAEGETGLLVPPDDPEALARALRSLASEAERRRAMGEAAARRARERFGLQRMIEATVAVYREAMEMKE